MSRAMLDPEYLEKLERCIQMRRGTYDILEMIQAEGRSPGRHGSESKARVMELEAFRAHVDRQADALAEVLRTERRATT